MSVYIDCARGSFNEAPATLPGGVISALEVWIESNSFNEAPATLPGGG